MLKPKIALGGFLVEDFTKAKTTLGAICNG